MVLMSALASRIGTLMRSFFPFDVDDAVNAGFLSRLTQSAHFEALKCIAAACGSFGQDYFLWLSFTHLFDYGFQYAGARITLLPSLKGWPAFGFSTTVEFGLISELTPPRRLRASATIFSDRFL